MEQIHTNYCKYVFGVRKNVANIAATSEFGRINLKTLRLTNIVKFWLKLLRMNDNRIAKKAYSTTIQLGRKQYFMFGNKCKKSVVILWFWRSLVFSKCW